MKRYSNVSLHDLQFASAYPDFLNYSPSQESVSSEFPAPAKTAPRSGTFSLEMSRSVFACLCQMHEIFRRKQSTHLVGKDILLAWTCSSPAGSSSLHYMVQLGRHCRSLHSMRPSHRVGSPKHSHHQLHSGMYQVDTHHHWSCQ